MNKKEKKIHLFIGWVILILIAILLFPDKNIALRAERPHLGQLSTRTIVAPFKFEVPKTEQEIQNEKARAADKINAIFEFNADETSTARCKPSSAAAKMTEAPPCKKKSRKRRASTTS